MSSTGTSAPDGLLVYDGSFRGWLSVVFDVFTRKAGLPAFVEADGAAPQGRLFGTPRVIGTDPGRAVRTERALTRQIGPSGVERLYRAFLSEAPGIELDLLRLVERVVVEGGSALEDLRFPPALTAERMAGRVRREVHRMHAFVRFEHRQGERYVAEIRSDYNVLPLIGPHFEARYPALPWAIVDGARGYALCHTPAAERTDGAPATQFVPADLLQSLPETSQEGTYQRMWQAYYAAVTIPERRNLDLQRRHMPKRYWPYLTEKRGVLAATSPSGAG